MKGIAESLPLRQGAANAAHFESKTKIILDGFESICVCNEDVRKSQNERDCYRPEKRIADFQPCSLEAQTVERRHRNSEFSVRASGPSEAMIYAGWFICS